MSKIGFGRYKDWKKIMVCLILFNCKIKLKGIFVEVFRDFVEEWLVLLSFENVIDINKYYIN